MQLDINKDSLPIFSALASETRLKILRLLRDNPDNIKGLANNLGISQAMTTRHIKILIDSGLICYETKPAKRGLQKLCHIALDTVTVNIGSLLSDNIKKVSKTSNVYSCNIPIGHYTNYSITPTCGLASTKQFLGMLDDPRFFADPVHIKASMLWFGSGWVEYTVPNYLLKNQNIERLEIILEICSEAPNYKNDWPSDILFSVNNIDLGIWTSPGDFGGKRGIYSPEWYNGGTQFGQLKTLVVNQQGSFIDGFCISDITLDELKLLYGKPFKFKISNLASAKNCGGVSLFGKGFGNYNQDIIINTYYK